MFFFTMRAAFAELFEFSTRPLAHPDATAAELAGVHGWTLHQFGTHAHPRSRERHPHAHPARPLPARLRPLPKRYAGPGPGAVARHVAATDPAVRRRPPARLPVPCPGV